MPWWRHLVSDCEVKSRTLATSVWQPTPLGAKPVVPVLRDRCLSVYIWSLYVMLVERFVLTQIKTIIIIISKIHLESSRVDSSSSSALRWKSARILRSSGVQMHWPISSFSSRVIPYSYSIVPMQWLTCRHKPHTINQMSILALTPKHSTIMLLNDLQPINHINKAHTSTVYLLRYETPNCRWAPSSTCWRLSFSSMREPSSGAVVTEQRVWRRIQISGLHSTQRTNCPIPIIGKTGRLLVHL